jgi:ribulose-5-phosphate 4-epimerase/fuculose-1-phosphate aldolase
VLSSVERLVKMYDVGAVLFLGDQTYYADDGVKAHVSVADALEDKRVVFMKNHGAIIASDSVENATIEAVMLEKSARFTIECEMLGATEIAPAEVDSGRRMYQKVFLPNMWKANVERLRRSDPDLWAFVE